MKTAELIEEAVSLPLEERARMVDSLLQSMNPSDETHVDAWVALARRRLEELRSGTAAGVPGAEVFERIRSRYAR